MYGRMDGSLQLSWRTTRWLPWSLSKLLPRGVLQLEFARMNLTSKRLRSDAREGSRDSDLVLDPNGSLTRC